jgi:hypothetical protein
MLHNFRLNFELGLYICPFMFSYPSSRMYDLNHLRNVHDQDLSGVLVFVETI